jgi:FKBP-type peptidyl-prolyl cis-trans isomerase
LSSTLTAAAQDTLPPAGQPQPPGGAAPAGAAGGEAEYRQQVSYALGRNFAQNLRAADIECDLASLMAGISDVLRNAPPKWTDEQLETTLQRFGQEMQQKGAVRVERDGAKNQQQATAFLAQNGKKEGVQTTASGLQYRVISEGNGASPTLRDTVRCNYRGMLLDGTEFDSSARQGGPVEFPVEGVIAGWTEALQKMQVGDKWQLYVPPKRRLRPTACWSSRSSLWRSCRNSLLARPTPFSRRTA